MKIGRVSERGWLGVLLGLWLITGCVSHSPGRGSSPVSSVGVLDGISREVLENGLTLLIKEDHRLPVVTTYVWYRVGSVNEPEGLSGVSHFLEHMLFKGTDKLKKGEIDWITFKNGGHNNAFTDTDYTAYFFSWSADRWEEALEIEANRMIRCTMDAKEFEAEKKVVFSELHRMKDSPLGPLSIEMDRQMFDRHPYGHPVLGWDKDLETMTRDQMVGYYKKYYAPNNAVLVVVGDVDRERVRAKVRALFEPIPAGASTSEPIPRQPRQEKELRLSMDSSHNVNRLMIGYRSDVIGSEADYVLDMASQILSSGKNSRLYRRLVEQDRLATEVQTENTARKHDGIFYISAELVPGASLANAEKAVMDELERLKNEPATPREMEKARNRISAGFLFGKETGYDLAGAIGEYETVASLDYLNSYLQRINSVTPDQIMEIARKIWTAENRTVGWSKAKEGKRHEATGDRPPGERKGNRQWRSEERSPVFHAPPQEVKLGEQWEVRLRNGLTVLVMPVHDLPVVSVSAYVDAGPVMEPEEKAGLANITGELLDEGIHDPITGRTQSHEDIAETIEFVGGSLSTSATGLSIKVMAKDTPLALDLLRDVLRYPSFPQERLELIRQITLSEIESEADHPRLVAQKLFNETVYGTHPLHRPSSGYPQTVKSVTRDDVLAHYRRFYRADNTIIAVAGAVDPESVINAIRRRFADWISVEPLNFPKVPKIVRQEKPIQKYVTRQTQQLNIYFGHLGIDRSNPDYYALRVMDHILGTGPGFTDRLSKQLRDEEGLAYTVWGSITGSAGLYPGTFACYMGTDSGSKDKAIQGILREITKFIKEGPTDTELRTAKDYLIRNFVFGFETTDQRAGMMINIKKLGLGSDYPQRYAPLVESVTRDDVMRVAQKYIDPANATLVIVGPVDGKGKVIEVKKEGE